MKHKVFLIYSWFIRTFFYFFPDIPIFMKLRGFFYGLGMIKCGKNFQVTHSAILNSLECFVVGNNVYIANFCNFIGNGIIYIEDNVIFGPNVIISAGKHTFNNNSYRFSKSTPLNVTVKNGSWIAANCTIVGECIFPAKSILAANSVFLTKSGSTENSLYAGNPAKFIKNL